jgi:hypothetical protein
MIMNKALTWVIAATAATLVMGLVGLGAGRYSVRKEWEQEKRKLQADVDGMKAELARLKDDVRKIRQAAIPVRAKANPYTTQPRRKGPYPMWATRPAAPSDASDYSNFPPTPLSQPAEPEAAER